MTVSPDPYSLSLPLVVIVGGQHGGSHIGWLCSEECLTTDEKEQHIMTCTHISYVDNRSMVGSKSQLETDLNSHSQ